MPFIQGEEVFRVHVIGVDVIIVRFYDIAVKSPVKS